MKAALALLVPGLLTAGTAWSATCAPAAHDWMQVADELAAAVRPPDCAVVAQTPPDFSWPDIAPEARYRLELVYPDGRRRALPAPQNWMNWPEALAPGTYRWRVVVEDRRGTRSSAERTFSVDAAAQPFVVPPMDEVLARVKTKPHPRGLPDARSLERIAHERPKGVRELLAAVNGKLRANVPPEPSRSVGSNNSATLEEAKRTLNSLAAYALTGEDRYAEDALRRVRNLASWDPRGSTSYRVKGMDISARMLTWALTLGYDWLHPRLDASTKSQLVRVLDVRLRQMYDDVIGERSRVARYPRDSHGQLTVTMLGVMATLLAGDLAAADDYARAALPLGANITMPWGGEDGGFANGTAYALWDVGNSQSYWYVLRWASGLDFAQKAWVRSFPTFLAYFNPPGTPARLFGDAAEEAPLVEAQARYAKGLAAFVGTPLARWYAAHLSGEDPKRLEFLLAPPDRQDAGTGDALPPGTANSTWTRSIGWVAMHSDLADPRRVSVYFKSSPPPFGAFNHQHADQNAFVVNAGGKRLAIESGYYDRYKSKHWWAWYKTTRAANAITFDDGQGQRFFERGGKMGYGRITRFDAGKDWTLASGDATEAYGGALTKALRTIAYLRPNLIVVRDRLASDTPRRWEWNIHALERMTERSERSIRIENAGESLCVDVVSGPAVRFSQTDAWTEPPRKGEPQWHGRFATQPLRAAELTVLMNVGCRPLPPGFAVKDSTVRFAGASLELD